MNSNRFALLALLALILGMPTQGRCQWVPASGLGGNNIYCNAWVGTSILIGTDYGLLVSTDFGATWAEMSPQLHGAPIVGIVISSAGMFATSSYYGVFLSTNNGATWTPATSGLSGGDARNIVTLGSNVYVCESGKFYTWDAFAQSWKLKSNSVPGFGQVRALIAHGNSLYLSTQNYVLQSDDGGSLWTSVIQSPNPAMRVYALAAIQKSVFAGTDGFGILRSTDEGETWDTLNAGLKNLHITAINASDSGLLAATDDGVMYRSSDTGHTWVAADTATPGMQDVSVLQPNGNMLIAGTTSHGLFLSANNGANWRSVNASLISTPLKSLASIGSNFLAATDSGSFLSRDACKTWVGRFDAPYPGIQQFVTSGARLFAGTNNDGVFRSMDGGLSWAAMDNSMRFPNAAAITALATNGRYVFAGTASGLMLRCTLDGSGWTPIDTLPAFNAVKAFAMSGTDVYAATGDGIYRSTSDGIGWSPANTDLDIPLTNVVACGSNLFAVSLGGSAYQATQAGLVWSLVSGPWSTNLVNDLAVSGANVFVGTGDGKVFLSTDFGANWTNVSDQLPSSSVSKLAVCGTSIFASTSTKGLWRRPLAEMVSLSSSVAPSPTATELGAYPNPSRGQTTLAYQSYGGRVVVAIVNLLGLEVSKLFDGELDAGEYSFSWDVHGMPPGTYECVVRTHGRVEVFPMKLLR